MAVPSTPTVQWPIPHAAPEELGFCAQRLTRIDDLMNRYVGEKRMAGVITIVVRHNRIAHLNRFGYLDLERKVPMRDDAIFRIYSMSKLVTSAATLMLMEEGHFILREPVKRFLPEFAGVRVGVPGADGKEELVRPRRDITIHDLLTHMAGLGYEAYHEAREKGWTLPQLITELCQRPLKRHPGLQWDYSAATDVLGRLIEVVSGQAFDVFLKERIFGPLGMTDTDFWVPAKKVERFAQVYTEGEKGLVVARDLAAGQYLKKPPLLSGGAGLVSTTSDYLRFALTLLHGEWNGVRLLGRKTHTLMTADHLPVGHPAIEVNERAFGLGCSVVRSLGETKQIASVGEFGWGGAACTQVWLDPAEDMITMLMLQHRPKDRFPLMDLFKQMAYQALVD